VLYVAVTRARHFLALALPPCHLADLADLAGFLASCGVSVCGVSVTVPLALGSEVVTGH
jgi:hypothetical protein